MKRLKNQTTILTLCFMCGLPAQASNQLELILEQEMAENGETPIGNSPSGGAGVIDRGRAGAPAPRPAGDSLWMYQIGGASPYTGNRFASRQQVDFGASASWSLLNSCSFDPKHSIKSTFEDAKENLYGLTQELIGSAQSLASAWGLSQIRELNPGMYDFLVKGAQDAKSSYNVAVKSCETMMADVGEGRNPADGWLKIAKKDTWKEASANNEAATKAQTQVKEKAGDNGISWPSASGASKAGGKNQPPANVITDTLHSGFVHAKGDGSSAGATTSRAETLFGNSEVAADWLVKVVGEKSIQTCRGCQPLRTRIGEGLRAHVASETESMYSVMDEALQAASPSAEQLNKLSAPGMGIVITQPVIFALQDENDSEKAILAGRLMSEVALARTLEKALVARDLLRAGQQNPDIAANDEAQTEINLALNRLDSEIDNVLFEQEVRSKVLTNTAATLSQRHLQRSQAAGAARLSSPEPKTRTFSSGGVLREGN